MITNFTLEVREHAVLICVSCQPDQNNFEWNKSTFWKDELGSTCVLKNRESRGFRQQSQLTWLQVMIW